MFLHHPMDDNHFWQNQKIPNKTLIPIFGFYNS
jgi:hypothetical protein